MDTKLQKKQKIPASLIYEIIEGKPVYYRGYKDVLKKKKKPEDIMGSSIIQSILVVLLIDFLRKSFGTKNYLIFTNESGVHFAKNDNISADIALVKRENVKDVWSSKYLDVAPQLIIEVDTKADTENFESEQDYFFQKTQKMLDFGVEQVIWMMTQSRKILIANQGNPWLIVDWDAEILVLNKYPFTLNELLREEGIL